MTLKTYTITLVDAVHYAAEIQADSPEAARSAAWQLWQDDFLRFKPVDDGSIEIISVSLLEMQQGAAGGAQ